MNILITDDHQLFLDGIQHILKNLDSSINIITTTYADEAITILESGQSFDLVLVDLNMPVLDGMSILQRMQARNIWLPLVIVSAEENIKKIKAALDTGAMGFIPKSHNGQQMLSALNIVLQGGIYIPENIIKQISQFESRRSHIATINNAELLSSGITKRQFEVLNLIVKGYTNKNIATTLFLTEHTVKSHVSALMTLLSAKNRTQCVQNALKKGILIET